MRGKGTAHRDWWLDAHPRYFVGQASRKVFQFDDQTPTVFPRFEVVWPVHIAHTLSGRLDQTHWPERLRSLHSSPIAIAATADAPLIPALILE
jgi:hypothetical protein